MPFNSFSFNEHLVRAIDRCGFLTPTPIQQQAIPPIQSGRDLLGLAQTGTGKTAAFTLPMVQHLMQTPARSTAIRALVIAPTRELAEQINDFTAQIIDGTGLRSLAIYGGVSKPAQVARLRTGVDIVVACPGRLLDILNDREIDLDKVEILVLDEADHMFDKGFLPDIRRILSRLPRKRQTQVFSATMPDEIRHLAEDILNRPVRVQISPSRSIGSIAHRLYSLEQSEKTALLIHLLKSEAMATTLVFTRTKYRARNLARKLVQSGFKATSLQGNLSQNRRQQALNGFKDGTYTILVATDIAARGIDVDGISHVINFDMPDTVEAYIHRTGRTGRAERSGEALSFATDEDKRMVRLIERSIDGKIDYCKTDNLRLIEATDGTAPAGNGKQDDRAPSAARPRRRNTAKRKSPQTRNVVSKRKSTSPIFGLSATSK
ncbi:MAG: DEAD/DEAH box helicase [Desulfopila sp.]